MSWWLKGPAYVQVNSPFHSPVLTTLAFALSLPVLYILIQNHPAFTEPPPCTWVVRDGTLFAFDQSA